MKIKSLIYALLVLGVVISFGSCRDNAAEPIELAEGQQLSFLPSIKGMNEEVIRTRAAESSFFVDDDTISVKITTSRTGATEKNYPYTYKEGTFTGDFKFSPDNTYISKLVALWPAEDSDGRSRIITDQREYENYKQANRLKATGSTENIMPTAAPVPLIFEHEQSRITFRLAGQNANGLIIKSLLLELEGVDLEDGKGERGVGFWAYCEETGTLNARMILPAGVKFGPNKKDDDGRMKIGLVTVGASGSSDKDYRAIMYIPNKTGITLKANHDYLVTLTPEGYDLMATVTISGFSQPNGDHVGIPFQLPVGPNAEAKYEINTVAQLVTISWLLAGDLKGESQSEWLDREFDIVSPVVVSDKIRAEGDRYLNVTKLKANKDKFSNTDKATYSDGITSIFDE